jgi:type IV pilus assembly protein PilV
MIVSFSTRTSGRRARSQRGFTMLEVLVALLILLIGLLGLAGLLVTTQQGEVEAYQRKQAAVLLQDMLDRLTGNPQAAGSACQCYAFTDVACGSRSLGTGNAVDATFDCGAGSLSQLERGKADLKAWNNALLGTSERKSGAEVGAIIDARGCVTNPSSGVYVVSVAWRGLQPTVAPPAAYTCGAGLYTDERVRRVISVTVRIANLTA